MSALSSWYLGAGEYMLKGELDMLTDDIKIMLVNNYTPSLATHKKLVDVTGEVVGDGYMSGGKSLEVTGVSFVEGKIFVDGADVEWLNVTVQATGAVIYNNTHVDKPLIGYVDFSGSKSAENSIMRIKWGTSGVLGLQI